MRKPALLILEWLHLENKNSFSFSHLKRHLCQNSYIEPNESLNVVLQVTVTVALDCDKYIQSA